MLPCCNLSATPGHLPLFTQPLPALGIWVIVFLSSGHLGRIRTPLWGLGHSEQPGATGSSLANWATGGGRPSPCASQRHTVSVTHTRTFYVQLLPLNSGCKFDSDFRQTRYLTKNLFLSLRHPDFEFEGLTLQRLLLLTLNGLYILQFFYLTPLSQLSLHGDLLPEQLLRQHLHRSCLGQGRGLQPTSLLQAPTQSSALSTPAPDLLIGTLRLHNQVIAPLHLPLSPEGYSSTVTGAPPSCAPTATCTCFQPANGYALPSAPTPSLCTALTAGNVSRPNILLLGSVLTATATFGDTTTVLIGVEVLGNQLPGTFIPTVRTSTRTRG